MKSKYISVALLTLTLAVPSLLSTGCKHMDDDDKRGEMHVHRYTCPHHPEVVQNTPGTCPKCGMKLEHKDKD